MVNVGTCERIVKKSYPKAGINHPTVHLHAYRKMSVSIEEYELILKHREEAVKKNAAPRGEANDKD